MIDQKLIIGKIYKIVHIRKGTFVAQLIDIVSTGESSPDKVFLTVKYDVRKFTDQMGLAINPGKDAIRVSNLRPSLIMQMEEIEGEDWLRQQIVPEEIKPKKEKGILDRLFGGRSN